MGRPIKKKFFGNLNEGSTLTHTDDGIGGEGIASVIFVNAGAKYSAGTTVAFSAPSVPGGSVATGTPVFAAGGVFDSITMTDNGSGYATTATMTITTATGVAVAGTGTSATTVVYVTTAGIYTGMTVQGTGISATATYVTSIGAALVNVTWPHASTVTGTIRFIDLPTTPAVSKTTLTTGRDNALAVYAFVPGGSSGVIGDIIKQESSTRYLVKTAQASGVPGQCRLVAVATGSLAEGEMNLLATDSLNSTYFVTKLTARRALLTQYNDGGSGFEYADGSAANWDIVAAVLGTVSIANL